MVVGCFLVYRDNSLQQSKSEIAQDNKEVAQIATRDTISREFRSKNVRQEVYYGKPEFFYALDMLRDQNVKIYPEDEFAAFPDPAFGLGSKIIIYRAPVITVLDGQEKKVYRTKQPNVSDFLQERNITLGDKDIVSPDFHSEIAGDAELTITRVSETTITEKVSIDFKTIKQNDPNLEKGKTKTIQQGKEGVKEKKYDVRRENGVEVDRKLISEEIIEKPQDEIISIGTKPVISVRCNYKDIVIEAAAKYSVDPNAICALMMKESNGHNNSVNPSGPYYGLFQYNMGLWNSLSSKAGFGGASWNDPRAQIFTTAWAFANGYRGHW